MNTAHTSRAYRTVPIAAQYIAADTHPERGILKPQQNAEHYAQVAIGESQHSLGLPSTLLQDQFVGMAFITQYTGLTDSPKRLACACKTGMAEDFLCGQVLDIAAPACYKRLGFAAATPEGYD